MRDAFGQEVVDHYLNRAKVELEALEATVTDWERFRGLRATLMARRPVIGVSAAVESAAWTVWHDVEVNVSQRTYTERIDEAGGLPLLLPTSDAGTADPGALLELVDGAGARPAARTSIRRATAPSPTRAPEHAVRAATRSRSRSPARRSSATCRCSAVCRGL